jgi:hypothetical protein
MFEKAKEKDDDEATHKKQDLHFLLSEQSIVRCASFSMIAKTPFHFFNS